MKNGMECCKQLAENALSWDQCLQLINAMNLGSVRWVVYTGESYSHKNYQHHENSLFDRNDKQDLVVNA